MIQIGVPKEIKNGEGRVGLTPSCVKAYIDLNAGGICDVDVLIEKDAGILSGYSNSEYESAGANIVNSAEDIYKSNLIIKVKEPIASEFKYLNYSQEPRVLFAYIHGASPSNKSLLDHLRLSNIQTIPYEEITFENYRPCLEPMSAIAGKLAIQKGAQYLEIQNGGSGILLGSLPGIEKANVLILGGGTVGKNAAESAVGLGANVTIMDINTTTLRNLDQYFNGKVNTIYSNENNLKLNLRNADLVVGAVLVPGGPPKIIKREHLALMKPNSLIVDVAIDEGGCVETSRITTHDDPIFTVDGIRHYCVANMPALVCRTATQGLTTATLPYGLRLARMLLTGYDINIKNFQIDSINN